MQNSGRIAPRERGGVPFVGWVEPTGRANARPMTGSAKSGVMLERSRVSLRVRRETGKE